MFAGKLSNEKGFKEEIGNAPVWHCIHSNPQKDLDVSDELHASLEMWDPTDHNVSFWAWKTSGTLQAKNWRSNSATSRFLEHQTARRTTQSAGFTCSNKKNKKEFEEVIAPSLQRNRLCLEIEKQPTNQAPERIGSTTGSMGQHDTNVCCHVVLSWY